MTAMFLAGRTYLELIGVADREKLLEARPWVVEFLEHYQGAHSVGLQTSSAQAVSDRLRSVGVDAPVSTLSSKGGGKPFLHVTPKLAHMPDGAIFFTEHRQGNSSTDQQPAHSNTADRILAVWILVKDLPRAESDKRRLGFQPRRSVTSKTLGARGREFRTDAGNIILLRAGSRGPARQFADERGEGVMGVTVGVRDLDKARRTIETASGRKLPTRSGVFGKSFVIPADLASGAWIEMTQDPQSVQKRD